MPRLLIVHHTPSPTLDTLFQAVVAGASADGLDRVELVTRAALGATVPDVLAADGIVLGTPANLGSMSGALKHFFDTVYYPVLNDTQGMSYGLYVHGNNDVDGAVAAIEKIATGLSWRLTQAPLRLIGEPDVTARDACWELGAAMAAGLLD